MAKVRNEFNYDYLRSKLCAAILPAPSWGFTRGNETYFGLQKIEKDNTVRKRVAVLPNMHVEIYIDDKIVPLTECIILVNMDQFISLLNSVDKMPLPNRCDTEQPFL